MAFTQITQAVLETARVEAERVRKAAEKAVGEKVRAARQASETECERRYQAAVRSIDEQHHRELMQVIGAGRKELLAQKGLCIKRVFDMARKQILDLPEDVHMGVMQRLLERACEASSGRVRVHPGEAASFKTLLDAVNAAHGGKDWVSLDETAPLPERGGFIFVSDAYEVDQRLSTLLQDLEHELAPHLAAQILEQSEWSGVGS